MVSGEIRDFQLSGSSRTNVNSYDQGRLLLPGAGWCAELSDSHPYFQVTEQESCLSPWWVLKILQLLFFCE